MPPDPSSSLLGHSRQIRVTLGERESDVLTYLADYPNGSFEPTIISAMIERGIDGEEARVGVRRGLRTLHALGLVGTAGNEVSGIRWHPTPEGVRLVEEAVRNA
jgi:hypothetical protein